MRVRSLSDLYVDKLLEKSQVVKRISFNYQPVIICMGIPKVFLLVSGHYTVDLYIGKCSQRSEREYSGKEKMDSYGSNDIYLSAGIL